MPDTYSCRNVSAQNCVCKNGVFSVKHQPVEPSTPHPPAGSHPIPRKKTFNLYVDQSVSMKANIPWNHAKRKLFVKTTVFLKKFLNYKTDRNRALHFVESFKRFFECSLSWVVYALSFSAHITCLTFSKSWDNKYSVTYWFHRVLNYIIIGKGRG